MKKILLHFEEVAGCAFMLLFVSLAFINVILRYFFGFIIAWAEEAVLIAFVWSVFLGFATAFRFDRHIAIDVVFNLFPTSVQKVLHYCIDILVLVLCLYMTWLSIVLCSHVGFKSTFVLRLPYFYIDLALVVSFGLMTIFSLQRLYRRIAGEIEDLDNIAKLAQSIENEKAQESRT